MPTELELLKLRLTCASLHGLLEIHRDRCKLTGGDPLVDVGRIMASIYQDVSEPIPEKEGGYTQEEFVEYLREQLKDAKGRYNVALSKV